jgi:hypothetical protein
MTEGGGHPITAVEFDFLWELCAAGEVPYPLVRRSHGATMDERAALRTQTLGELARRGIVDPQGKVEPRLAAHFEVLAAAELSVDSVHVDEPGGAAVLAVVGTLHGRGLLAVQDERGLWLKEVPNEALASTIVSLLPPGERGRERSITMPVEQLMAGAGADFLQRKDLPVDGAGSDDDRKVLARLHAQERLRGGQIGANVLTEVGSRSRSPVLSWFDTESGRYLTRASAGADGREWITIAPADMATMRQRIAEMIAGVQRAAKEVV